MRIDGLAIQNYKSLLDARMENISDVVILAGANRSGKSSVLEAIAALAGAYGGGGYLNLRNPINNNQDAAKIQLTLSLAESEKQYLRTLVESGTLRYRREIPDSIRAQVRFQRRGSEFDVRQEAFAMDGSQNGETDLLMRIFREFDRTRHPTLGFVEYFAPIRRLPARRISTVDMERLTSNRLGDLRLAATDEKFSDVKDYLAHWKFEYLQKVGTLLERGVPVSKSDVEDPLGPIRAVLRALLSPKEFVDVRIDRAPFEFVCKYGDTEIDIDDLSSGEKEVFSAFVTLLKRKLVNSILLIDEPDLHLHQEVERRLVGQLRELGENNQIWIATHSLGIINSAEPEQLFLMREHEPGSSQVIPVFGDRQLYDVFRAVAGETGIITLARRIVFLEGTEYTDAEIMSRMFQEYKDKLTFIETKGVTDVMRIRQKLLELLERPGTYTHFFAIRDRDFLSDREVAQLEAECQGRFFVWRRYHIENYLLDARAIWRTLDKMLMNRNPCQNDEEVSNRLREAAVLCKGQVLPGLLNQRLQSILNSHYSSVGSGENGFISCAESISRGISRDLDRTHAREMFQQCSADLDEALRSGRWQMVFPGRCILNKFLHSCLQGLPRGPRFSYEVFRNQIVNELKEANAIPSEIQDVVQQILAR